MFALYGKSRFGLTSYDIGFILAYVGILIALVQGVLIGFLTKRFEERKLLLWSLIVIAPSFFAWAFAPSVWFLLLVMIPIAFAGGVIGTVNNSMLSKAVSRDEIGGTLGLAAALGSVTSIIGPILGGFLIGTAGAWGPGVIAASIAFGLVFFVFKRVREMKGGVVE